MPSISPFTAHRLMKLMQWSERASCSTSNSAKLFESNWDPYDDSGDHIVQDSLQSGLNVAKSIRAVMEPLVASHFGGAALDELFREYTRNVAKHLQREKTMYSVIVLSLQRR